MEDKDADKVEWNGYTGDESLPIAHHESARGEIVPLSVVDGEITKFVTSAAGECRCSVAQHVCYKKREVQSAPDHADQNITTCLCAENLLLHIKFVSRYEDVVGSRG